MRDPYEQLHRIQNAIIKIGGYTGKGRLIFDREEEVRLSVIHYLYTIGEAAYAIPQDFKDNHPEIPWKQLVSFRNFLTFYYIEIDKDAVWKIIVHDLPNLKPKIDLELEQMVRGGERGKNLDSNGREGNGKTAPHLLYLDRKL